MSPIEEIRRELGAPGRGGGLAAARAARATDPARVARCAPPARAPARRRSSLPGAEAAASRCPTYAWQRERYWVAPASPRRTGGEATGHPLLGVRVPVAGADAVYESVLSAHQPAWLGDHRVAEHVVVPGAALAELVRGAAEDQSRGGASQVTGLVLQAPLVVPESDARRVQVVV